MTNTKFRRRALISSVAMLLVALVALGSATFAWFTENPQVKAEGITAEAQTSTGLEISTTTDTAWSDDADFMKDGNDGLKLVPAYALAGASSITWLTATAETADSWAPASSATWGGAPTFVNAQDGTAASGAGVYHEQALIKVKNGEPATVSLSALSITTTANAPDIKNGVTVVVSVGGVVKAVKKVGADAIKNYASAAQDSAIGSASGTYPNMFVDGTPVALGTAGTGTAQSAALTVDVYVFLDGTDKDVKTNNAIAGQLIDKINMTFVK